MNATLLLLFRPTLRGCVFLQDGSWAMNWGPHVWGAHRLGRSAFKP